jgi:anti-sigma-K factor RskA
MNCQLMSQGRGAVLDMVVDYCAGAMEAEPAAEFERHVAHCGECAAMVAEQRKVWEALDEWGLTEVPEVSPDFDARLYARIAQEQTVPAWRRWLNRWTPAAPGSIWKPALSMVAACAVLAIGLRTAGWMDLARVRGPEPAQNTAQMQGDRDTRGDTHVDIEQVANALDELDLLMPASHSTPGSQGTPAPHASPRVM